ncbi:transcription factor TFIIE beta subunit, TFIIEB, Tfa2, variant 2 [Batrachochytrium dendrobatidis]|nr:transcription factor TFIIE beta subunit, TFIIEB, Tfa2, variant 2 [Batrachochytrium dendrobatidis]
MWFHVHCCFRISIGYLNYILAPVLYSSDGIPVARKLFDIIMLLKAEEKPLTNNDMVRKLAMDIMDDEELFDLVRNNERIFYDGVNGTFEYRPTYKIRSKEDLLELLKKNRDTTGMEVKELKDSCNGIFGYIEELDAEKSILIIRNRDESPRIVYYNNNQLHVDICKEFKEYWHQVALPLEADISKELASAGLKSMEVIVMHKSAQGKAKTKAKRKTRFKLTNTHLEGIDLTKEFVPTLE